MIWILGVFQVFAVAAAHWVYNVYISQPKYNHPPIFWNTLPRFLIVNVSLLAPITLVTCAFFLTDSPWAFLLFTVGFHFVLKKWLGSSNDKGISNEAEDTDVKDNLTAIIKMYNLRRAVDVRLSGEKMGQNLPEFKLWATPEAIIANATALYEILQDDGHSEKESVKKICHLLKQPHEVDVCKDCNDLLSYLKVRLKVSDPEYLDLGDDILNRAVEIAKEAARIEIDDRKQHSRNEFTSDIGVIEKFPYNGISDGSVHKSQEERREKEFYSLLPHDDYVGKRDWLRFQIRASEGDEIWMYLEPFSFFHIERAVLVRGGKVIDEVRAETPFISFSPSKQ